MLRGGAPAFSLGPGTSFYRKIGVNPLHGSKRYPVADKVTYLGSRTRPRK
jgi:hypothetical protein